MKISVKKIFSKYSNFLKHRKLDLPCQKKIVSNFSSSSIHDFFIVCLVIFTISCSMMYIYTTCGVWEFGATMGWDFATDDKGSKLLLLESSYTLDDFKII